MVRTIRSVPLEDGRRRHSPASPFSSSRFASARLMFLNRGWLMGRLVNCFRFRFFLGPSCSSSVTSR